MLLHEQTQHRKEEIAFQLKTTMSTCVLKLSLLHVCAIGGAQTFSRDSKDKEIFAMLDEIRIANKENLFLNPSNMAAKT